MRSRCYLLDAISRYLPLGINKYFSVINTMVLLQQQLPDKHFTADQILKEIQEYYNLDALDDHVIDEDKIEPFELPSEEYKSLMEERSLSTKRQRN
ncbi:hypothetical protein SAMD00019534_120740 [Acytostelium subglobosum LB1]|uniref:hypothetical protein n=1 Tax=Acytostelium subglobosum LB1 TaxID=1410327 RepID=UPI000644A54C|nr:hypothetical protein SAMD00019534_120740 [Acytostelium subglobosum LB1]GAM28898.1 hypothetical protein SAMD00019534_120740 [Acytostelium subglobosum LB1]|eukprot:XP_012748083.1 hypothetical protein SAMD00019534_120740 [Acytostelium subglobosum LB1]